VILSFSSAFSLVGEDGKIDARKADFFENTTKVKRGRREKGRKVTNNLELETKDSLNLIHKFFGAVRDSFFHLKFPNHGTKIRDMETSVPEYIVNECDKNHTDIIVRLIAESLHRLVFDDRDTIMGKELLTSERKFIQLYFKFILILAGIIRLELSKSLWSKITFKETNELAKHKKNLKKPDKSRYKFVTNNNSLQGNHIKTLINKTTINNNQGGSGKRRKTADGRYNDQNDDDDDDSEDDSVDESDEESDSDEKNQRLCI